MTPGSSRGHEFRRIGGQERALDADALHLRGKFCKMIDRELRGIEGRSRSLEGRGPELPKVLLVGFHPVPDIGRLFRPAFDIDEKRQITADANGVEMIEEEEPIAAEEILDVVLGRDHHCVHAGLVKEIVKARAVKWKRCRFGDRRQ